MHSNTFPRRGKGEWPDEMPFHSKSQTNLRAARTSKTQGLAASMRPVLRAQQSPVVAAGSGARGAAARNQQKKKKRPGGGGAGGGAGGARAVGTKTGGLTFGSEYREGELEVVRAIVLREEYLGRLAALAARRCRRGVPDQLPDLLDLARVATVEAVEAIRAWRQAQERQVPFMWNGLNYLLKIPSDLDFLDQYPLVTRWLGFPLCRNPFAVPLPLDQRPSSKGDLLQGRTVEEELYPDSGSGFLALGNRGGGKGGSALGDIDMLRVRDCEKTLLQEEELHGRYMRGPDGRLVPEAQARRAHLAVQLRADDRLDLHEEGHEDETLAPFTELAGPGRRPRLAQSLPVDPRRSGSAGPEVAGGGGGGGGRRGLPQTLPGKLRPERLGGELGAGPGARGTRGRRRRPAARSAGAALDLRLAGKKEEVARELAELRAQLADAERRLAEAEAEAAADWAAGEERAATQLQALARGASARRADRAEDARGAAELRRRRRELAAREARAAREAERLAFLEAQRAMFKDRQRRSRDQARAEALERKRRLLTQSDASGPGHLTREAGLTLEDVSATEIQKIVRGVQGRALYARLRARFHACATAIQAGWRGLGGRRRARRARVLASARVDVQRAARGFLARRRCGRLRAAAARAGAALGLQRLWRGRRGRRRHAEKKRLAGAAAAAAAAVGRARLFPTDVQELADLIGDALHKEGAPYPPPIYLGVLRTALAFMAGGKTQRVTVLNSLGLRETAALGCAGLGWEGARRALRRGARFLRLLRRAAAGPAGARPRLLALGREGLGLYKTYRTDPMWTTDLEVMSGPGSKAIRQLILWIENLVAVWNIQDHFLDDVGSTQPAWLQRFLDGRRGCHRARLRLWAEDRAAEALQAQAYAEEALDGVEGGEEAAAAPRPASSGLLGRVLRAQRAAAAAAREDLAQLEAAEAGLQAKEHRADIADQETLQTELERQKESVAAAEETYKTATERAKMGGKLEERALPSLLLALQEARERLKEQTAQVTLGQIRLAASERKRRRAPDLPTDLQLAARRSGEARAALLVREAERRAFAAAAGGEAALHALHGEDLRALRALDDRLARARAESEKAAEHVRQRFEAFDAQVRYDYEEERRKEEAPPQLWDEPTEEEFLEDAAEDEAAATEEARAAAAFVPRDLVAPERARPRPLLVLLARDLPKVAKERLAAQLAAHLPGQFARVDLAGGGEGHPQEGGLCSATFQAALGAGRSVLAEVDHGLAAASRRRFLRRLEMVKACLVPVPACVLLAGHLENGTRDGGGVADRDLRRMADARLKRRLQIANDCLEVLAEGFLDGEMRALAVRDHPPSPAYIAAVEAVTVLLSPQKRYRAPAESVPGVVWHVAKRMLSEPATLAQGLKAVDKYSVPLHNLVVLEQYLEHPQWPGTQGKSLTRRTDPVLYYLARWAQAVTEAARLVGPALPERLDRRHPEGLFSAVVTVYDRKEATAGRAAGWEAAYNALMGPVLEDVHVHRQALRLDGEMHTVNVYQDGGTVFLGAYNHRTSAFHLAAVREDQVSDLLAPNSMERAEFGAHGAPKTRAEVFARLAGLLVFERDKKAHPITGEKERRLVCRRKLVRLWRGTLALSGHLALATLYEEARGDLRCHAYLPQYSRALELVVDAAALRAVLPNAHPLHEAPALRSRAAALMLPAVRDRLAVQPGLCALRDMGRRPGRCAFRLLLRKRGGPGRPLYRAVLTAAGRAHIITVNEVGGAGGSLWVRVYDARSSRETQLWLAPAERLALFGARGGRPEAWAPRLHRRLSLRRYAVDEAGAAARAVHLDRTVFCGARALGPRGAGAPHKLRARVLALPVPGQEAGEAERLLSRPATPAAAAAQAQGPAGEGGARPPPPPPPAIPRIEGAVQLRVQTFNSKGLAMAEIDLAPEVIQPLFDMAGPVAEIVGSTEKKQILCNRILDALRRDESGSILLANQKLKPIKTMSTLAHGATLFDLEKPKKALLGNRTGSALDVVLSRSQAQWKKYDSREKTDWEDFPVRYVPDHLTGTGQTVSSLAAGEGPPLPEDAAAAAEAAERAEAEARRPAAEAAAGAGGSALGPLDVSHAAREALSNKGEIVFKQGVMMRREGRREVGMVVTVWRSYVDPDPAKGSPRSRPRLAKGAGGERQLLFEVYDTRTCERAFAAVTGTVELKEVVGAAAQGLLRQPDGLEAAFYHICRERALVKDGTYNPVTETYERRGNAFSVVFERDRLYSHLKQTPLHLGGDRDRDANQDALIAKAPKRGVKVLRQVRKVNGLLLHVTCYDVPRPAHRQQEKKFSYEEDEPVYRLRYQAYNPKTGHLMHVEVGRQAIYELAGGRWSPLLAPDKRRRLAEVVAAALRLRFPYTGPPRLVVLWSGEAGGGAADDGDAAGGTGAVRRPEERVRRRGGRLHTFGTAVGGCKVVLTVFAVPGSADLRYNAYAPRHAASAEVVVPAALQRHVLGGRQVADFEAEEARRSALENIARQLTLRVNKDPGEDESVLELGVEVNESKPWLAAYKGLDTSAPVEERPSGNPLVFVPATAKGDPLLRRGVKVAGQEVLVSVFTRGPGRPGAEGLVFEAYNPQTCATATLHLGAPGLEAQVNGNPAHLAPEALPRTTELLLYRLVLQHDALGRLKLSVNHRVMPSLFEGAPDLRPRAPPDASPDLREAGFV